MIRMHNIYPCNYMILHPKSMLCLINWSLKKKNKKCICEREKCIPISLMDLAYSELKVEKSMKKLSDLNSSLNLSRNLENKKQMKNLQICHDFFFIFPKFEASSREILICKEEHGQSV